MKISVHPSILLNSRVFTTGVNEGGKLNPSGANSCCSKPASGSSIPVGIAIGRQRQQDSSSDKKRFESSDLSGGDPAAFPAVPSASGPSPWTVPPGPHSGPSHYPAPAPFAAPPSPWLAPPGLSHPMGPIPMGYQLAKDPLTGQMLLIPTGEQ
jgi:hypothetical protein